MATTITLSSETHDRLRRLTLRQSGQRGVRLTMESVLVGLLDLADAHPDELEPVVSPRRGAAP